MADAATEKAPVVAAAPAAPAKAAWMEAPKADAPAPAAPTAKIQAAVADPAKPAAVVAEPDKPAAAIEPVKTEPAKAPEKYDLKAPEGVTMEAASLEKFGAEMKALGLSQEQAQKLLVRDHEASKASRDAMVAQLDGFDKANLAKLQTRWGDKFPEMSEKVKRVFDYADPKGNLRKEVEAMKMAHAPELIEFVERFVPLFEEPSLKAPSAAGVTEKDTRPLSERLKADYQKRMAAAGGVAQPH